MAATNLTVRKLISPVITTAMTELFYSHLANKDTKNIQILLNSYPDLANQCAENGDTPLSFAIRTANDFWGDKDVKIIELLIGAGADVNKPASGDCVRQFKAANNVFLTKTFQDVNMSKTYPLYLAVKYNQHAIIPLLIAAGADVNMMDEDEGATPLYRAAVWNNNPEMVRYLILAGADVNKSQGSHNILPIHEATNNEAIRHMLRNPLVLKQADKLLGMWEMPESIYTNYFQWLPREVAEDTIDTIPVNTIDLPSSFSPGKSR